MMPVKIKYWLEERSEFGNAYVGDNVRQPSRPVRNIEIGITKPTIAVSEGATPFTFGHMVVKMHVDTLFVAFGGDSIKDLCPQFSALTFEFRSGKTKSYLQSRRLLIE